MSKNLGLKDYARSLNKKESNLTLKELEKFLGKDVFQDFFDYLESKEESVVKEDVKRKTVDPKDPVGLRWLVEGKEDPHAYYAGLTRSKLSMKDISDDELANMVYMDIEVDRARDMENIFAGKPSSIAILTSVKERLRWLSRQLAIAEGRYIPKDIK